MNLFFWEILYSEIKLPFNFQLEYFIVIIVEQRQLTGILDKTYLVKMLEHWSGFRLH